MTSCRICGGSEAARYTLSEFMFQTGDSFPYFECADCGCLQIEHVPADIGRFYPPAYYSLNGAAPPDRTRSLRRRLVELWAYDRRGGPLAAMLYAWKPDAELRRLRDLGVRKTDSILDVGSGRGDRVARLQGAGFERALGIDPYLERDVVRGSRVIARRVSLTEVQDRFRLVTFHHVLEHMPDQHAAIASARRLVADDGFVLVRVPTVSSEAWAVYRDAWAQLDPPRHLYLHSRRSLSRLAEQHGLRVASIIDDSEAFQFWGSELVRRGRPLANGDGKMRPHRGLGRRAMTRLRKRARDLNRRGQGDQFAAVLVPA